MSHDRELEQASLYAFGVLSAKEAEEVEAHLLTCLLCQDEFAAIRDTASVVGTAAEVLGDQHELRFQRIKKKIGIAITRQTIVPRRSAAKNEQWYRFIAAAAIVVAIGSSLFSTLMSRRLQETQTAFLTSEHERMVIQTTANLANQQLAILLAPNAKRYAVPTGLVVANANHVYLAMSKLPALPTGHTFQAWVFVPGTKRFMPSSCFGRDAQGAAFIELPNRLAHSAMVAVTIEPSGGSRQPTTKPLFIQALT